MTNNSMVVDPLTTGIVAKLVEFFFQSRLKTGLLLFLSGAIYPLAFSPFDFWPLIFVSIVPLLFSLTKQTSLSAFKLGFYWGLGAFSVGASWVYVSIHEFGFVPWYGAIPLTLLFVAYLALFKGLFAYLSRKVLVNTNTFMLILIAPCFWLLSEYLQSVIFSGFPWLLAGYSQIDSPLAGLATWFGVYGISWFVLAFGAIITLALQFKNNKSLGLVFVLLAGLVFLASILNEMAAKKSNAATSVDIALVQPNISQHQKWDRRYFYQIIDVLEKETKPFWGADLIIWPEGAIPAYAHQVKELINGLTKTAIKHESHLILGIPEYEPKQDLSFVALQAYGKQPQNYHKQVLVPFGEYVPLQNWLRGIITFLDLPMSGFSTALTPQHPMTFEKLSILPAICYEIVYPGIIRDLSLKAESHAKQQLIVTVSNDAWFGDSLGPYQHMQMARMRALELGLPLVRSTNDGITAMVNNKGEITHQLPRYLQGGFRAKVVLNNIATPYRQWGNSGIYVIILISLVFIILSFIRKSQSI